MSHHRYIEKINQIGINETWHWCIISRIEQWNFVPNETHTNLFLFNRITEHYIIWKLCVEYHRCVSLIEKNIS